jgi:hypothetical protein
MAVTAAFLQAQHDRRMPVILVGIENSSGVRVYAKQLPTEREIGFSSDVYRANGSVMANGSALAGLGVRLLDRGARLMSASSLRDTLIAQRGLAVGSLSVNEIQNMSVTLNNGDRLFSQIFTRESFLNGILTVKLGFRGLMNTDFLTLFTGRVVKEQLSDGLLQVEAASL